MPRTTGAILGKAIIDIRAPLDRLKSDMAQARGVVDSGLAGVQQRMAKAGAAMRATGATLTRGVTVPLVAIGAVAVKNAMTFEESMNVMKAISGATTEEMARLEQMAFKLGTTTVFSAQDAADAMLELAKSGVPLPDIFNGATDAALALAAAGGTEVREAAVVMTDAMQVFGLVGSESMRVADALAGAANASSAEVHGLMLALSQGAGAAKAVGLTVEEAAAALAVLADNGIKGSDAGTSLKVAMMRLAPHTKKAAEEMNRLGIDFTNADGTFKDLVGISEELKDGLGGLTDSERVLALQTMFGTDAFRTMLALYEQSPESLQQYIDAASESGNATDVAAARMEGLPGAVKKLTNSLETASIVLGKSLGPIIEDVAAIITWLAVKFSELDEGTRIWIGRAVVLAAVLGPVIWVLGALTSSAAMLLKGVFALGGGFLWLLTNPVGWIILGLAAVVTALVLLWQNSETARNIIITGMQIMANVIAAVVTFAIQQFAGMVDNVLMHAEWLVRGINATVGAVARAMGWEWGHTLDNAARSVEGFRDRAAQNFNNMTDRVRVFRDDFNYYVDGMRSEHYLGVTVETVYVTGEDSRTGGPAYANYVARHKGGHIGAAGEMSLVGERGPELVRMPAGANVLSNNDTGDWMSKHGGDRGGQAPLVVYNYAPIGGIRDFADELDRIWRDRDYGKGRAGRTR